MNLIREITNPEQLDSMFGGELSLDGVELSSMLLFAGPNLRLSFNKNQLPDTCPDKWKLKQFNAFSFCLEFSDVNSISIQHWESGMKCDPKVKVDCGLVSLEISRNEDVVVSCKAGFLTLSDVSGYIDSGVV